MANPLRFPPVMLCSQQHPTGFIVLRESIRSGRICRSPVQRLYASVNHRMVQRVRPTAKIFTDFTSIDWETPVSAARQHAVHRRITAFRCVHTYRRCRASDISRHGRICSRLGACQLSGTYVHSALPQFSDIRGLISDSMPRYPHTLRPVAFVTVFVCSRLYVFRFRIRKSLNERCRMGVSPFSSHQIP